MKMARAKPSFPKLLKDDWDRDDAARKRREEALWKKMTVTRNWDPRNYEHPEWDPRPDANYLTLTSGMALRVKELGDVAVGETLDGQWGVFPMWLIDSHLAEECE